MSGTNSKEFFEQFYEQQNKEEKKRNKRTMQRFYNENYKRKHEKINNQNSGSMYTYNQLKESFEEFKDLMKITKENRKN